MANCIQIGAFSLLTTTLAAPAAVPVTLPETSLNPRATLYTLSSYSGSACTTLSGVTIITKTNSCAPLLFKAKSLKFQLTGIPSGCVLYGFSDTKCAGYNNIWVIGPTDKTQCYKTLPDATTEAQTTIQSVKLQC
jgi:hypothetical protein